MTFLPVAENFVGLGVWLHACMAVHVSGAHKCYAALFRQKLSTTTEKRGPRASFKLSKKLPFIKKVDKSTASDDDGKGVCNTVEPCIPSPQ